MGCALHNPACAAADDDADEAAGNADEDGLDEELRQDVHSSGAHTHAQTDFAGTLRYGYIHDVHDVTEGAPVYQRKEKATPDEKDSYRGRSS